MSDNPIYHQALKNLGFEEVEYISSGQFGAVYKGLWTEHDGVEHAIKILKTNSAGQREAKIYRTISDARKKSKLIAKHFPRVDMVRSQDGFIFIVMELLEADPNVKGVIGDIFGYSEVDLYRPDLALSDVDINKDIG